MNKLLLVTLSLPLIVVSAFAQTRVVAQYDFEDVGFATSRDGDADSAAGTFTSGPGITGFGSSAVGDTSAVPFSSSSATGDFNNDPQGALFTGSSANQTTQQLAVDNNDYVAFTITPAAGLTYDFNSLQFKLVSSGAVANAPEGFFVRSNRTGATNLAFGEVTTSRTIDGEFTLFSSDLTAFVGLQDVTTATEFRFYFYNPDGAAISTGLRIDKVQLQADVVPEPSTYAMIGLGAALLVGVQRFRRKNG